MKLREDLSEPLHRFAIRCLRHLRQADLDAGLSSARLSALSVIVFAGPLSPSVLAEREQVSAPTMTKLLQALQADKLIAIKPSPDDARQKIVVATAKGRALMHKARDARLRILEDQLNRLNAAQQRQVARAVAVLESLFK